MAQICHFGYTDEHIRSILQHFEQVSQTKSHARVDEILELRRPEVLEGQLWHLLDPLDPLRMCLPAHDRPRGVPIAGTILGSAVGYETDVPIEGNRPNVSNDEQTARMKKGEAKLPASPVPSELEMLAHRYHMLGHPTATIPEPYSI